MVLPKVEWKQTQLVTVALGGQDETA